MSLLLMLIRFFYHFALGSKITCSNLNLYTGTLPIRDEYVAMKE